jgi:phosphoglycolate phosphatase-like HAD superfamily hydrolase
MDLRGRTDTSIVRDLLEHLKVAGGPEEEKRLRETYLSHLPKTMPDGNARVLAGIHDALEAVHKHPEIHQALLTGNIEAGAKLKLSYLGLWDYFEFGAFADDSHIRNELGPFALRRAKEKLGIDFPPESVWIIGDTPHDVACGKAIGAKTIAVATGAFSVAELSALNPTHTFADFSDTQALLDAVVATA